jgi:hypothetical protein
MKKESINMGNYNPYAEGDLRGKLSGDGLSFIGADGVTRHRDLFTGQQPAVSLSEDGSYVEKDGIKKYVKVNGSVKSKVQEGSADVGLNATGIRTTPGRKILSASDIASLVSVATGQKPSELENTAAQSSALKGDTSRSSYQVVKQYNARTNATPDEQSRFLAGLTRVTMPNRNLPGGSSYNLDNPKDFEIAFDGMFYLAQEDGLIFPPYKVKPEQWNILDDCFYIEGRYIEQGKVNGKVIEVSEPAIVDNQGTSWRLSKKGKMKVRVE